MNYITLILGNLCSIFAMVSDSASAAQKTHAGVLRVQNISQLCYCTGAILLGGYSAAVQNAVSILRNIVAIRNISKPAVEWFLVGLGVVLGIVFNNLGLLGWIPIIASAQYSIAIFRFKDNDRALKVSFFISASMFAVFSVVILNLVGVVTNSVVAISTVLALIRSSRQEDPQE